MKKLVWLLVLCSAPILAYADGGNPPAPPPVPDDSSMMPPPVDDNQAPSLPPPPSDALKALDQAQATPAASDNSPAPASQEAAPPPPPAVPEAPAAPSTQEAAPPSPPEVPEVPAVPSTESSAPASQEAAPPPPPAVQEAPEAAPSTESSAPASQEAAPPPPPEVPEAPAAAPVAEEPTPTFTPHAKKKKEKPTPTPAPEEAAPPPPAVPSSNENGAVEEQPAPSASSQPSSASGRGTLSDYFPATEGQRWAYRYLDPQGGSRDVECTFTKDLPHGVHHVVLEVTEGGRKWRERYSRQGRQVEHTMTADKLLGGLLIIELPHRGGSAHWTHRTRGGKVGSFKAVFGKAHIEQQDYPDCLIVTEKLAQGGKTESSVVSYYAKGTGLVAVEAYSKDGQLVPSQSYTLAGNP